MTLEFATLFFGVSTFIYAQAKDPVQPGWRALASRIALCAGVGAVIGGLFMSLGLFDLSGIDPNAGQYM